MAYRAPEIPKYENRGELNVVGGILQLLEKGIKKTENEANNWVSQVGVFEGNLGLSNNKEDFNNLVDLIPDMKAEAELYDDVLGTNLYSQAITRAEQIAKNKSPIINGFNNSMIQAGTWSIYGEGPARFDAEIFFEEGHGLGPDDWVNASRQWNTDRGGAPIRFDTQYSDYGDIDKVMHYWIQVANSKLSNKEKAELAPIPMITKTLKQYEAMKQSMISMGIEMNSDGTITNMPDVVARGVQTEYDIPYQENGETKYRTMSLQDIAKEINHMWNDYSGMSYILSNQTVSTKDTKIVTDENGQLMSVDAGYVDNYITDPEEWMRALTMDYSEFVPYAEKKIGDLKIASKEHGSNIDAYTRLSIQITNYISDLQKAVGRQDVFEGLGNLGLSSNDILNAQNAGIDISNLGKGVFKDLNKTIIKLEDTRRIVDSKATVEKNMLKDVQLKGIAWGAYDLIPVATEVQKAISGLSKDKVSEDYGKYIKNKEVDKVTVNTYGNTNEEWNKLNTQEKRDAMTDSHGQEMNQKISLAEVRNRFGDNQLFNEFLGYYLGAGSDEMQENFNMVPMSSGSVYRWDGASVQESPLIDFDSFEAPGKDSNWTTLLESMHPGFNLDSLYVNPEDVLKISRLWNYSELNDKIINETAIYGEGWDGWNVGEDLISENIQKLKRRFSTGYLSPHGAQITEDDIPVPTARFAIDNPITLNAEVIQSGTEKRGTKVDKIFNPNDEISIVWMGSNYNLLPSRNSVNDKNENLGESSHAFFPQRNEFQGGYLTDPLNSESYKSNFKDNLDDTNLSVAWYWHADKPEEYIIADKRGNLYLIKTNEFIRDGISIIDAVTRKGEPIVDIPSKDGNKKFNLIRWNFDNPSIDINNPDTWSDDMFNFPIKDFQ